MAMEQRQKEKKEKKSIDQTKMVEIMYSRRKEVQKPEVQKGR